MSRALWGAEQSLQVRRGTMRRMDALDLMQWPAMVVTLIASWLVASRSAVRRNVGFWVFLASNVLWVVWGWHAGAYALIALQVGLAAMNIRGAVKTRKQEREQQVHG